MLAGSSSKAAPTGPTTKRGTLLAAACVFEGKVFTLRPIAPLESGEYVLCRAVSGGANLDPCYRFAVQD
jgi:hypothetical protein